MDNYFQNIFSKISGSQEDNQMVVEDTRTRKFCYPEGMCAVTHRPYQLALLMKKNLNDVLGTQQSACEAILQNQYKNIHSPLSMLQLQKVLLINKIT